LTADIAECVFAIRSQLHSNNSRLGTPPDEAFSTISDFAGEIARTRQLYRDRKRAQTARISAEEGVAARAERREALKHAAKFQKVCLCAILLFTCWLIFIIAPSFSRRRCRLHSI
jgi:hypothetical protein